MKIIFLGTNGWYDTKTGNTICTLIDSKDYYIIFDAGNGIAKLDKYLVEEKPVYLFIGHFHFDHIEGLHVLDKFDLKKGLFFVSQAETRHHFAKIINFPFTKPIDMLSYKTDIYELPNDEDKVPFEFEYLPLKHSSYTLGYRVKLEDKVITYLADTGLCDNAVKLANNADILITECALKPGHINEKWPHLNPEMAAQIAKDASVKQLYLTHFDAAAYPDFRSRKIACKVARNIFKKSYIAFDEITIKL